MKRKHGCFHPNDKRQLPSEDLLQTLTGGVPAFRKQDHGVGVGVGVTPSEQRRSGRR